MPESSCYRPSLRFGAIRSSTCDARPLSNEVSYNMSDQELETLWCTLKGERIDFSSGLMNGRATTPPPSSPAQPPRRHVGIPQRKPVLEAQSTGFLCRAAKISLATKGRLPLRTLDPDAKESSAYVGHIEGSLTALIDSRRYRILAGAKYQAPNS
ncbi:hypothetical protein CALCODRAFT_190238 [Calocera cornea HHB12733]|uniref:Uncharacterized protein n=1 Tax=Calocera cornea HHB12733 TaxID=1353952 RepID=A0A165C800_9BASI|nr:hypothetical protein CALCODRAFT_190238 [Calocera cornea HHB12733]